MSKSDTLAKVATALSMAQTGLRLAAEAKKKLDERRIYTLTLSKKSYTYQPMLEWLNTQVSPKNIELKSTYEGVRRLYSGEGTTMVVIKGHTFKVTISRPEAKMIVQFEEDAPDHAVDNLVFQTADPRAIDALEEFLLEITEEQKKQERRVLLYGPPSQYGWENKPLPERNLDSVFLQEGQKESLLADMDNFLGAEERYHRIGIPWHRGYIFCGKPGNGKSSLAAALAHHYRLNLYNLPLSTIKGDRELAEVIGKISKRSILLLEDIDIFTKSLNREQNENSPTLAGLLNALDGVATPHGLVTIMTTNNKEALDDALIRKGRIDYRMELCAPTRYQVEAMFKYAYGEDLDVEPREFGNMADLSDVFKRFTMDPESARMEIKDGFSDAT